MIDSIRATAFLDKAEKYLAWAAHAKAELQEHGIRRRMDRVESAFATLLSRSWPESMARSLGLKRRQSISTRTCLRPPMRPSGSRSSITKPDLPNLSNLLPQASHPRKAKTNYHLKAITMSQIETDEPMFPVASGTSVGLPNEQAIVLRFDFLTNALQPASAPNIGRNYVLLTAQARALAQRILSLCDLVESTPPQPSASH